MLGAAVMTNRDVLALRFLSVLEWRPAPDKHNEYVSPFLLR